MTISKKLAAIYTGIKSKELPIWCLTIIEQRMAVQAGLAEVLGNPEAAGKRIARLLPNPRIAPKEFSEMVFEQTLKQLPKVGKIRLKIETDANRIEAKNLSEANKYVQEVFWNGRRYEKISISHREIVKGGKLTFVMTDKIE